MPVNTNKNNIFYRRNFILKLYIHNESFQAKPNSQDIKRVSRFILDYPVEISIKEFAREHTELGKTVLLCELKKEELSKLSPIKSQSLIMLDFDNKDLDKMYTLEDLENDDFMLRNASFYYKTFSDVHSKFDKFRVVFQLDTPLSSNNDVEALYQKLFSMYPQADSSVGQTSRMFFGSNSGYIEIDFDNRLNLGSNNLLPSTSLNNSEISVSDSNLPIYLLLKNKQYDLVKQRFGSQHSNIFPDDITASNYFKSLDMKEFLELPDGNPFVDILHEEENPSASIYFAKDLGIFVYKCFSQSNSFQGDIVRLLSNYLELFSFSRVIDLLISVTNSEINYSNELGIAKRDYNDLRKQLRYNQLKTNYPELYSYINRYEDEIIVIMDVMFDFTYLNKETGEVRYLNYLSIDKLTSIVNRSVHKKISKDKMWDILNLIIVTEMVTKVPFKDIPKELFTKLIYKQQTESKQIRTSNVYEPSINLEKSYEIAKELKRNNVTVKSLGFELVYRLFGEEKAEKDYPQAYKPLIEKGIVKGDILPNNNILFEKLVVEILFKELDKKEYIFEDRLLELIAKKMKEKIPTVRKKYTKIRFDIVSKYDLVRERNNQKTHERFKISSKFSPKIIIFKK